jgi:hypothetical protein
VRKVVVASSVSTIYLGAFANLPNATGIDLSGFSGSIGNAAFAGCSAVTEIDLSGFSGSIGANAFSGCTNLAQSQSGWLTLPPGVTSIGQSAFSGVSVFPPGQQSGGVILTGAVAPSVHPNWATGLQAVYYPHAWGSGFGPITSSPARYDIPVLTAAAVTRTAVGVAEVAIESVWNGSLYRQVDGAMPSSLAMTVLSTNAAFRSLAVGTQVVSFSALTPGAHTLYFAAEQASGLLPYNVSAVVAVPIPAYQAPAGGGSGWDGSVSGQYQSARLSPRSAVFDKNPQGANHRDISATLDLGSYVFSGIQYGNAMLTAGTDYAVSGNAYTFRTAYLSTLPLGDQSIVFVTSGQDPPTLRVTVIDSALAGGDGTGTDGDGDGDGDVDASGTGSGEDYDLDDGSGAGSDGADGSGSGSDGTGNGSGTPDTGDDAPMMPMLLLVCLVAGAFIQLAVMLRRECRAHRLSARP